jgi:hypothetical protein
MIVWSMALPPSAEAVTRRLPEVREGGVAQPRSAPAGSSYQSACTGCRPQCFTVRLPGAYARAPSWPSWLNWPSSDSRLAPEVSGGVVRVSPVTISSKLTTFAGLPIVAWDDDNDPADPTAVAWRLEVEDFDADTDEVEHAFEALLKRTGEGGPVALVVGEWGSAYDLPFPVDLLVRNAARLPRLRALFAGELTFEQCEISWINQADLTPLLEAFPALERLWVRGSEGLRLTPMRHEGLRELVLQSGGLPAEVVRAVGAFDLPRLTHLELWLGVDNYGGDARADDLAPILTGRALPALTSLGLRNAEIADEVAAAVAAAPVVARLTELDLSMGVLSDTGAEALLAGQPLTHLKSLNLSHHFLSEELAQRLVEELPGVRVDVSDRQQEEEWGRYTAVAE